MLMPLYYNIINFFLTHATHMRNVRNNNGKVFRGLGTHSVIVYKADNFVTSGLFSFSPSKRDLL